MLSLQVRPGEYMTIGGDVVVQLDRMSGDRCKLLIDAPRELTVLRGEVLERGGGQRPDACSTPPAGTAGRSPGTGARPRPWPPCGPCWPGWTAGTATCRPCGGSLSICSPARRSRQIRFLPADEPAEIQPRTQ
ncbi:MAG: carbon storage regulator [Oscillospiraceae bacterium]|nr:carbon storage regulator [Oscillospiraceae bacterium]